MSEVPVLPDEATLASRGLAEAERRRRALETELAGGIAQLNQQLAIAKENRRARLAAEDVLIAEARIRVRQAEARLAGFRAKLVSEGLAGLGIAEVHQLLHILGVPVARSLLDDNGVVGMVLIGLTEIEMATVFKLERLGDRRRLSRALQRLANQQGLPDPGAKADGALDWDVNTVCSWLARQNMPRSLCTRFRGEAIDGAVLLGLDLDDLETLAVTSGAADVAAVLSVKIAGLQALPEGGASVAEPDVTATTARDDDVETDTDMTEVSRADETDHRRAPQPAGQKHDRQSGRTASSPPPPPPPPGEPPSQAAPGDFLCGWIL